MSYINYENIEKPTKKYDCELTLLKSDLDTSLYDPLIEVIGKLNLIGNYIKNNEDSWSSEGLSGGGDTLEFPLSAINGLQTSSTNKILYYNDDGDWEYKDYKELKFPLSELYNLTSDDLDGDKWILVYDLESSNGRGWKFLPYNTGTGSGLTPGKVAYDLNTVNNPNTNVKQILVWDNDGNGTWKWQVENYTSSSSGGLTWNDLINQGSEKIHSSHLPSSWWGRPISNNIVEGNLSGNIQYIKFDSGGHTVYLGLDSDGNLRVSKSENGNDGSTGANFYATGGVSALGNSSSSGGGGGTPGETSLKSLLNNVNDSGTNYANPDIGYTIVYNGSNWVDRKLNLSELGNVLVNNINTNDVLTYNGTNWVNSQALSVVSSLGLLSDVDDTVSDIKALNVIQPSGSILSYSYPLTLLVGSTSETSSNIYDSEVEWKLYVFLLETDSSAAHLIDGGSLTSNMGIVTRLNFGQAGSLMNNYRFPTYITGVRLQSNDVPYYLTGSKHFRKQNPSINDWNLDYDETFCSQNVYIQNGELYSGGNYKVLTTNSTLSSSKLNNNSVTFNGASASLGSSGIITPELLIDGNTIKSKVGNQTSGGITVPFATTAGTCTGNAGSASRLQDNTPHTIWGQTYWENGQPKNVQGSLIVEINNNKNNESIKLFPNSDNEENPKIYMLGRNVLEYERSKNNTSVDTLAIGFGAEGNNLTHTNIIGKNIELTSTIGNVYIPNASTLAKGLRIGDAVLYWDSQNNSLAVKKYDDSACNFYAFGGVSALGMSPGTSSVDAMTFGVVDVTSSLKFKLGNTNNRATIHTNTGTGLIIDNPYGGISINDLATYINDITGDTYFGGDENTNGGKIYICLASQGYEYYRLDVDKLQRDGYLTLD